MIIALLALAFAMIVGGLLTAFFGWDIVLIERGWTMVIAGTFSAACGAILLGITAAVSKLARIQAELARLQVGFDEEVREETPSSSTGLSMAALAGGLLGGRMFGRSENKDQDEKQQDVNQPDLPLFSDNDRPEPETGSRDEREEPEVSKPSEPLLPFPPRTTAESPERRDEEDVDMKVPDFLLGDRVRDTHVEARTAETSFFTDEPKLDEPEDEHERRSGLDRDDILEPFAEPVSVREPEPARKPEPLIVDEPAPEEQPSEESATEGPRSNATIIGTYNSGENTYVMFSDGSIEAQTPGGVFRFQSLDELKAFIASGGEGGTSAT